MLYSYQANRNGVSEVAKSTKTGWVLPHLPPLSLKADGVCASKIFILTLSEHTFYNKNYRNANDEFNGEGRCLESNVVDKIIELVKTLSEEEQIYTLGLLTGLFEE